MTKLAGEKRNKEILDSIISLMFNMKPKQFDKSQSIQKKNESMQLTIQVTQKDLNLGGGLKVKNINGEERCDYLVIFPP